MSSEMRGLLSIFLIGVLLTVSGAVATWGVGPALFSAGVYLLVFVSVMELGKRKF